MNQSQATKVKDEAFEHLIKGLESLVKYPELSNYTGELGALLRRRHRNKRAEIDAALHPQKTAKKKEAEAMTAEEVEQKTFHYPSNDHSGLPPAQTTSRAQMEKEKKRVAAGGTEPLKAEVVDDQEGGSDAEEAEEGLFADITEDMTPEEIADSFGGLPSLKQWLKDNGVKVARNASAETAAKKLAEFLEQNDQEG